MLGTGTMALSLGLTLVAGNLVAPQVASAAPVATVPVAASAAVARAIPKMSQSVNRKALKKGQAVTLTAKVINTRSGNSVTTGKVRLQAYRSGWKTWQTVSIKKGKAVFVSKPAATVKYRTVFLGNAGVRAGTTGSLTVTVTKSKVAAVLAEAAKHKGSLYKFGASGPKRFDCSGFTMYVYKKAAGKKLPHKANSQQRYGKSVSKGSKKAGDLIVYRSGGYGYHVGIYAGNGYMYDSPHTGARVSKRKMFSGSYVVRRLV